jgi:hypothetical protein
MQGRRTAGLGTLVAFIVVLSAGCGLAPGSEITASGTTASGATGSGVVAAAGVRTIWVDPVHGRDTRSGATAATALRSLGTAWGKIPKSRVLDQPVKIMVRSGTIAATAAPNYWEDRWGTASSPITIVSADGPGRARLPSINMYNVRHLILDGITIRSPFDAFHCEKCSYIELRRSAFVGIGDPLTGQGPQESVKINQSDHIRITDSYLAGATDNALDMVAVQHAYIARNTIAHAVDWCTYAKGGSIDIQFISNDVHHCGTGGITLGQGTGFQFMVAPQNNYEVYGASVLNNVLHDIEGSALGVNGGFVTLLAYNTAYRIGTRDHLLEVVFGERSCDGTDDDDLCARARDDGGWGPRAGGGDPAPIGNSQVAIVNNLLYNPTGTSSQWAQFGVYAPRPAGDSGGPDPAVADDGLIIRGNAIWNGTPDLDLGLGGDQGCQEDHPTCAPDLVRAGNAVNTTEPPVRITAEVVPVPTGQIAAGTGAGEALPTFNWVGIAAERGVTPVTMPATLTRDRAGLARADHPWQPGAYLGDAPITTLTARITGRGTLTARTGDVLRGTGGPLSVLRGDWLELRARPATGQKLLGWSGACAGQPGTTCLVPGTAGSITLTARFG